MPFDGTYLTTESRLLLRAVEILDEVGWCQRVLENAKGNMCIIAALGRARRELGYPVVDQTHLNLSKSFGVPVIAFNDAPDRTYEQVRAALVDAAFKWDT